MKKYIKQLKKKALAVLIAVTAVSVFMPAISVQAAEAWQDAYATSLRANPNYGYDVFSLYDIDRNGMPELFTSRGYSSDVHSVYMYTNSLEEIFMTAYGFIWLPTDPSLPGIFAESKNIPVQYITIENRQVRYTDVGHPNTDGAVADYVSTAGNQQLYAEFEKSNEIYEEISYHDITEANIQRIIYGWISPTATAPSHPFAIALREFFSDAHSETGAYLINMPGVGEVVYARKVAATGGYSVDYDTALFWLNDGNIDVLIGEVSSGEEIYITESKHVCKRHDSIIDYYVFENGQLKKIMSRDYFGSITPEQMRQHGIVDEGGEESFYPYGDGIANRPNDTARILTMTANTTTTATPTTTAPKQNKPITVTIDGQRVNFTDQQPDIIGGRTLVPVRGVFEQLGFVVSWNEQARQATLSRANDKIVITIDSATFTANGVKHTLDVPAQIIGGSTMLPIRAVLESVGYGVGWDEATHTVIITVN